MKSAVIGSLAAALAAAAFAAELPRPPAPVFRFGVVSFYNPRLMYIKYQPLIDYLNAHTGHHWELVIGPSYERTVEDLCSGALTAAYLGPYTYERAHARCGALPVVKLNTGGKPTYRSLIMVRADNPIKSLKDLAGQRFGFGSPMSTSSHLMPRAMLAAAGLRPGVDLACRYYFHHERAARAVLLGEVDACGVRDIVGEKFTHRGLRILATSQAMPNFPFVVAPRSPASVRDELFTTLVEQPVADPAAGAVIKSWDEELSGGFVAAADSEYTPIRRLAIQVFGPHALTLSEPQLECGPGKP